MIMRSPDQDLELLLLQEISQLSVFSGTIGTKKHPNVAHWVPGPAGCPFARLRPPNPFEALRFGGARLTQNRLGFFQVLGIVVVAVDYTGAVVWLGDRVDQIVHV